MWTPRRCHGETYTLGQWSAQLEAMTQSQKRYSRLASKQLIWCEQTFLKWAIPSLLFVYSWSLQTTIKFIQQINGKNDPSNIRHWDSNSRPLGHETSLITTRLGLLLLMWTYFLKIDKIAENEQKYIDGKIGPLDILLSNHQSQVGHDWLKWERERDTRKRKRSQEEQRNRMMIE